MLETTKRAVPFDERRCELATATGYNLNHFARDSNWDAAHACHIWHALDVLQDSLTYARRPGQ
jgi:hypothetical protein